VYILNPVSLVYIGPNIEEALTNLIADLFTTFNNKNVKARHIATTYSLANIAILFDCFEPGEAFQTSLVRLRYRNGNISGSRFEDRRLSQRIIDQLQTIQRNHQDLTTPFRCVEDWQGFGPQDHPIYDRMVEASGSIDKWRKFRGIG
jgi:hypothetical protein